MKRWAVGSKLGFILFLACPAHASSGLNLNGGSVILTGPAELNTTGDIALSSGTLQCVGTPQLHIGGNWASSGAGSFLADQSTVFFTSHSALSGSNTFGNLTGSTPGQTLTLQAGVTQTITHSFTLNGSAGSPSQMISSVPGNFAGLINQGSNSVSDVHVQDINAFGGIVIDAGSSSVLIHTINWSYGGSLLTPQLVTQVAGQSGTLSWAPVSTYTDGSSVQPGIGTTYEISRYTDLGNLSNGTLATSGLLGISFGPVAAFNGDPIYYGIRAVINGIKSDPFYVDNSPTPTYAFASSNGSGYVLIPPPLQSPFAGLALPYVYLSLTTQVAPAQAGVLASGSLHVNTRGSGLALTSYQFSPPGATMVLEATGALGSSENTFPVQLNVDGTWRTVGTATYSSLQNAFTFTVYQTGVYRVGVDPLSGMSSVLQSVHPRIFSPNGDGYNDVVHFDLNNPDHEPASGEIFDLHAAKVASMEISSLGLLWDGRGPGGRIVPGGVYVYQIHLGHQRVNGTVVVVK
jgi:hypothetical protein